MSDVKFPRRRRFVVRTAAVFAALAVISLFAFLPFAGRFLVVNDPLEQSDVIFVLAGARVERWLEGVDLRQEGWAPRIVLSPGRVESAERILRQRGVHFPTEAELARDAMLQLQVDPAALAILVRDLDNTAHEASAFRAYAAERGWTRVIVVTSKYHSRRTRFAFQREFQGSSVRLIVRSSRYDVSTPERWWRRRGDVRYVISEISKLLLYRLGVAE